MEESQEERLEETAAQIRKSIGACHLVAYSLGHLADDPGVTQVDRSQLYEGMEFVMKAVSQSLEEEAGKLAETCLEE